MPHLKEKYCKSLEGCGTIPFEKRQSIQYKSCLFSKLSFYREITLPPSELGCFLGGPSPLPFSVAGHVFKKKCSTRVSLSSVGICSKTGLPCMGMNVCQGWEYCRTCKQSPCCFSTDPLPNSDLPDHWNPRLTRLEVHGWSSWCSTPALLICSSFSRKMLIHCSFAHY